jgi:FKBP-type peptidyl-prolyl cis-trans isomerase (trigger factor)
MKINEKNAVNSIKEHFIIEELKKLENIEADKEEIENELKKIADAQKKETKDIKRDLIQKGYWESFKDSLIFPKLKQRMIEICSK